MKKYSYNQNLFLILKMSLSKPEPKIIVKRRIFPRTNSLEHFSSLINGPSRTYIDNVLAVYGLKGLFDFMRKDKLCPTLKSVVWEETKYLDLQYLMCQHVAYSISSREEDIRKIIADTLASLEFPPTWDEKNTLVKEILCEQAQRCLEVALLKPRFLIE